MLLLLLLLLFLLLHLKTHPKKCYTNSKVRAISEKTTLNNVRLQVFVSSQKSLDQPSGPSIRKAIHSNNVVYKTKVLKTLLSV